MTREELLRLHRLTELLRRLKEEAVYMGLEELDHLIGVALLSAEEQLTTTPQYVPTVEEYLQ
jgi:hypothetical protein